LQGPRHILDIAMAFGAKTVAVLLKEVSDNASMEAFEVGGNASIKMKSTAALEQLAEPLKKHKSIKRIIMSECEITDDGCKVLADILTNNHVIEELDLDKNKIGAEGARMLADALSSNKGLRILHLMGQTTKNFGEETLEHFITMFGNNITLTKIMWRLESRKANVLNKLQTRNVEIKKRKDKGEDCNAFLPDHLKSGAAAKPAEAPAAAAAEAPKEEAPAAEEEAPPTKRSSVKDMEEHVAAIEAATGEELQEAAPEETPKEEGGYKADDAPVAEPEAAAEPDAAA